MKKLLIAGLMGILSSLSVWAQEEAAVDPASEVVEELQNSGPDLSGIGDFVDAYVKAQMQAHDVPAASVSIVKDGEILFARGYGMANIEKQIPVTAENTLFRPGSVSKLFTWTAVMQQVEAGNLDLNTDVNEYLKTFQIPDTYDEPITLTHVLTHTAGFEEGGLGYLIVQDEKNVIPMREALAKYIPRRINKPGAYSSYSNYATALAGQIVENVSGIPFNEYIKQKILDPLGMTKSSFVEPLPDHLKDDMAIGYKREGGVNTGQDFEIIANFGPAGALSATSVDMAKFMMAHLNEGRLGDVQILKPETTRLMHSQLYTADERMAGMAHGFYETYMNGRRLVGHGGDTFQFHSDLALDKEANLGIFGSFEGDGGASARGSLVQAIYDEYFPDPVEPVTPPADFEERASKYAGQYKFWRHNQSGVEKVTGVMGGLEVVPTDEGTLLIAGLFEPRQFVEIGKNMFRQVDGTQRIFFVEDADGAIKDFYLDGLVFMSASRAPAVESALFAQLLPIVSLLLSLTVWIGWCYRRKEFKEMTGGERTAIKLSLGMSAANLLFVVTLLIVLTAYADTLYAEVPFALKLVLVLPNIAAILSLGVVWFAVNAWRDGYWRTGRKVHYSLVAVFGIYLTWFYYYWNLLGIQLPG